MPKHLNVSKKRLKTIKTICKKIISFQTFHFRIISIIEKKKKLKIYANMFVFDDQY